MGSASPTLPIRLFSVTSLVAMLALITGTPFLSHPMGTIWLVRVKWEVFGNGLARP